MQDLLVITKVKYLDEYKLELEFNTGELRLVDLKNHLTGYIFKPLANKEYFKKVAVNFDIDTICWDNGADFAPEFLYEIGKPSSLQEIFATIPKGYKRGSFDIKKNSNLVIDMILNNMKIEGQEVPRQAFLKLINESNASH